MFRKIARALVDAITPRIRRRPAFFATLGAIVVFSTILIKDNIAEAIRSNMQSVDLSKQFYELQIKDIDLDSRLDEIGASIDDLKQLVSTKVVLNVIEEKIKVGSTNMIQAAKDEELTEAANANTDELMKQISDSDFFFDYSNGEERMVRDNLHNDKGALASLVSDIKTANTEWTYANGLLSTSTNQTTREEAVKIDNAYDRFRHDAVNAAIQAHVLKTSSLEDQAMAVRVASLYGQLLEKEDEICNWVIIVLVVLGSTLGLLSQLAGVKDVERDAP